MAKYSVVNSTPTTADFWWRQPLINADGSLKTDVEGNIQVEQMVVRTVDSDKLDTVAKFIAQGGSFNQEEIDTINKKLAELEEKINDNSGTGSVNYAICSYTGASSYALAPAKYNVFVLNLTEAETTVSIDATDLSNTTLSEIRIYLKQGTGSNIVNWGDNIKWLNDITPTLSYTQGKTDIVQLSSTDGGYTWLGSMVSSWN